MKDKMKFYYAPLEGMTGYIYRNVHRECYKEVDKYFAPFIVTSKRENFKNKDLNDVCLENNKNYTLIPQVLTNNSEEFIYTAEKLIKMGYNEININLGCPSKTVISKYRGSGFLAKVEELDKFFDEIFKERAQFQSMLNGKDLKISVKTRIGKEEPKEFDELMSIYNKYPLEELIIHPRVQKDFYSNTPNYEVFQKAFYHSKNPICYNGDIKTVEDYKKMIDLVPELDCMMLGRGLIANPALLNEILTGRKSTKEELKVFHDKIYLAYQGFMSGDVNTLYKMKEIWLYMIHRFDDNEKLWKKIRKSNHLREYEEAVSSLFQEKELI